MYETPADMDVLQALLDRSVTQASPFLRALFE
jgi:hypothetical protein